MNAAGLQRAVAVQSTAVTASVCDFSSSLSSLSFASPCTPSTRPAHQRRPCQRPAARLQNQQPYGGDSHSCSTHSRLEHFGRQTLRTLQQFPRRSVLSVIGLAGGLAAPVLVSGGGGSGSGSGSGEGGGGGRGDGFGWDKGQALAAPAEDEDDEEEDDEEEEEEVERGAVVPAGEEGDENDDEDEILADIAAFDDNNKKRVWPATFVSPFQTTSEPDIVELLRKRYVGRRFTDDVQEQLLTDFTQEFGEFLESITLSLERNNRDKSLRDGEVRIIINWREQELPPIRGLVVGGTRLITEEMKREMLKDLQEEQPLNSRRLKMFKERLKMSFAAAGLEAALYQMHFVEGNILRLEFLENRIGKIGFKFTDENGKSSYNDEIAKCLPVGYQSGDIMKSWDALGPLQEGILAMGAFSRVGVGMKPRAPQGPQSTLLDLEIQCELAQQKSVNGELDWQFIPNESGRPTLYTLEPGGTITYQHSHFGGWNKQVSASIGTSNFFSPMEDIGFNISYKHINVFGSNDPKKRKLTVDAFNGRKESAIHSPSPALEGIPEVTVDRAGVRATLTEFPFFSKKIEIDYGATLEEVNCRGEDYQFMPQGQKVLNNGTPDEMGPPTTIGPTGSDKQFFLHGSIAFANTKMKNEVIEGTRALLTMEQGTWLGIEHPMFNRWTASATHYMRFDQIPSMDPIAVPSAVVHAKAGDTIGDLAPYDAHPLGGPYTVRAYNIGDLGAARRFLELATEVHYPIRAAGVYGFAEYATDLGSGREVPGDPNEYYQRPGHGLAIGGGIEWCGAKLEYVRDCNKKKGAIVLRHGNRF